MSLSAALLQSHDPETVSASAVDQWPVPVPEWDLKQRHSGLVRGRPARSTGLVKVVRIHRYTKTHNTTPAIYIWLSLVLRKSS